MVSRAINSTIVTLFIASAIFANSLLPSYWINKELTYEPQELLTTNGSVALKGLFNAQTGAPVRVSALSDAGYIFPKTQSNDPETIIEQNLSLFKVNYKDLEILYQGIVKGKIYFTARQKLDNRPVIDTRVILRLTKEGKISLWGADVVEDSDLYAWTSSISEISAASELARYCGLPDYQILSAEESWIRIEGIPTPAYMLQLAGDRADERPFGVVSAENGEIFGYYNHVYYASLEGKVDGPYLPEGWNIAERRFEAPVRGTFPYTKVFADNNLTYTAVDGLFLINGLVDGQDYLLTTRLEGRYVEVRIHEEEESNAQFSEVVTVPAAFDPHWESPLHGRRDEFNLYYHTNFIHDYYKRLDPRFVGLDYPMGAYVDFDTNYPNAFWNGYGIYFGTGNAQLRNLALFSDIIYHEYTHGVTDHIYPDGMLPYEDQSGAMNEAWSDYFPCSIHNHSGLSVGVLVDTNGPMRDLNNTKRFPDNWIGEVHSDGMIIGGAMWDVREVLGAAYCDSLFHFARYGLAETFEEYLVEVLEADDNDGDISNGTPHDEVIYVNFGAHGIGPGWNEPKLVLRNLRVEDENDDGELAANEHVEVYFSVQNDLYLYPPPAVGVRVWGGESDYFTWQVNDIELGDIYPGETVLAPEPLRFIVNTETPPLFTNLILTITANLDEYEVTCERQLLLGSPRILIVDDDGANSYHSYYIQMMIEENTAANSSVTVTGQIIPDLETLYDHDIVIWHTGDNRNPLSTGEMTRMQSYVASGGNVILTGQYIGNQLAQYPEFANFIGVAESIDSLRGRAAVGIEDQPLSTGITALLVGADGAWNQRAPSGIIPTEDAVALYTYYYDTNDTAAVWKNHSGTGGGVTVYFGFGLEAVSGGASTQRACEVLHPLLEAMNSTVKIADKQQLEIPYSFTLSVPYPNPFNQQTTVQFTLPEPSDVHFSIMNLLGQKVEGMIDQPMMAGEHRINIDLSRHASGVYLLYLQTSKGVKTEKAVLIK